MGKPSYALSPEDIYKARDAELNEIKVGDTLVSDSFPINKVVVKHIVGLGVTVEGPAGTFNISQQQIAALNWKKEPTPDA